MNCGPIVQPADFQSNAQSLAMAAALQHNQRQNKNSPNSQEGKWMLWVASHNPATSILQLHIFFFRVLEALLTGY